MIVVAAGHGSRFRGDKMVTLVGGEPLIALTVRRVRGHVDTCVLVCRREQVREIDDLGLDVVVTVGGPTRTASETAGLEALGAVPDLVGIHDGARPNVSSALIERLFAAAEATGGAVPVFRPDNPLVDRGTLRPLRGLMVAQTPQVFWGKDLVECYRRAQEAGYTGRDTADVMSRFSAIEVAAVPGEPENLKVTYPQDVDRVVPG
jgi:2-C-methyl-D-erythritol 4-phosphate cytidylyltransferase